MCRIRGLAGVDSVGGAGKVVRPMVPKMLHEWEEIIERCEAVDTDEC